MDATFVIGFHTARIDNLLQTLRFLIQDHADVVQRSQLVTVCQNDMGTVSFNEAAEFQTHFDAFGSAKHFDMNLDEMKLPLVTNTGVEAALSDKVVILESDRLLPAGYFQTVLDMLGPKKSITCSRMVKMQKPYSDEELRLDLALLEHREELRTESNQIGVRNMWSGNTAIWKPDYYEAGTMDEAYVGYGWADCDMTNAMARIGVENTFLNDDLEIHLWHPPATYGRADQKQLFIDNGLYFCRKWGTEKPRWFREEIRYHRKFL